MDDPKATVRWTLGELKKMPLRQFMGQCPTTADTRDLRCERLFDEALSLDALRNVAQPRGADPVISDYDKELRFDIQEIAEHVGIPIRSVQMPTAYESKSVWFEICEAHEPYISLDSFRHYRSTHDFRDESFTFVHPDIVTVLEGHKDFGHLSKSPLWLLYKAIFYVRGTLSHAEHSLMTELASSGQTDAVRYVEFAETARTALGVRAPEPKAIKPSGSGQRACVFLSGDELADELGVTLECLVDVTLRMDRSSDGWYCDYVRSLEEDESVPGDADEVEDDWDGLGEPEWEYEGQVWDPRVVDLIRYHPAFPLSKLEHGIAVNAGEHQMMETIWDPSDDLKDLAGRYIALSNRKASLKS